MTDKPRNNITDIYNILYSIDKDSLRKITEGKTGKLAEGTKIKLLKAEDIAKELGWDKLGLNKAINTVLTNI